VPKRPPRARRHHAALISLAPDAPTRSTSRSDAAPSRSRRPARSDAAPRPPRGRERRSKRENPPPRISVQRSGRARLMPASRRGRAQGRDRSISAAASTTVGVRCADARVARALVRFRATALAEAAAHSRPRAAGPRRVQRVVREGGAGSIQQPVEDESYTVDGAAQRAHALGADAPMECCAVSRRSCSSSSGPTAPSACPRSRSRPSRAFRGAA
jgi:hypothetical protein